jgi:hypothetical protein
METFAKIYLSIPVAIANRPNIINVIGKKMANYSEASGNTPGIGYYKPGQVYDNTIVSQCDIFVFTDLGLPWHITIDLLPVGVRRELITAMSLCKPIYYIYKTMDGEFNLYKCAYQPGDTTTISNLAGTSSEIFQYLDSLKKDNSNTNFVEDTAKKVDVTTHKSLDKRLLL